MNQKVMAGIGNLYSDEILFQARIHPRTSVARLDDPSLEKLHEETLKCYSSKSACQQVSFSASFSFMDGLARKISP